MRAIVETKQYVRKPFAVDAVRVTEDNLDDVARWCNGKVRTDYEPGKVAEDVFIEVKVLGARNERQGQAFVGDWVLRKDGNFKVYTPRAFENNFVPVYEEDKEPFAETSFPIKPTDTSVNVPEEHV